jgi:hypothetical protein
MQDKGRPVDPAGEDKQSERAVLLHILECQPATLRVSDLIRELADPDDFPQRDRVERAIHELTRAGLLFRHGGAVLPTRQTLYLSELELA